MDYHKLPQNATAMLMQTQERKNLVQKLMNLKTSLDKKEPKQFNHLNQGRIQRRNQEVKQINNQNQHMLHKIMSIMNRKPQGNGLDGVPIKRNRSTSDVSEQDQQTMMDTYQGKADIRLIESNVEAAVIKSRFSFEFNPSISKNGSNQFGNDNNPQTVQATRTVNSPESSQAVQDFSQTQQVQKTTIEDYNDKPKDVRPSNPFSASFRRVSESSDYSIKLHQTTTFENALGVTQSEEKIENKKEGSPVTPSSNMIHIQNQERDASMSFSKEQLRIPTKKLLPGQITLNHVQRKKEVRRINRENKIMLTKLKSVKPSVERLTSHLMHYQKIEQMKQHVSKFRAVGKSQPRMRIRSEINSDQILPLILGAAQPPQSEMKHSFLPEVSKRSASIRQRKTSQGDRSNGMWSHQSYRDTTAVPFSQRAFYRDRIIPQLLQNEYVSTQQENQSTRLATTAGEEQEQEHEQEQDQDITRTGILKTNVTNVFSAQSNDEPAPKNGSITFSNVEPTVSNHKQPTYLQKLKRSPLLSSIAKQQNIPNSIINRVVNQRQQQKTEVFRKYGILLQQVPAPRVKPQPPQFLETSSIIQSNVNSSHSKRRKILAEFEAVRNVGKTPALSQQIDLVVATKDSQKSRQGIIGGSMIMPVSEDGASLEPKDQVSTNQLKIASNFRNQNFQIIQEEKISNFIGPKTQGNEPGHFEKVKKSDDYTTFTHSNEPSIQVSGYSQAPFHKNLLCSGDPSFYEEQHTPELPAYQNKSQPEIQVYDIHQDPVLSKPKKDEKNKTTSAVTLKEIAGPTKQSSASILEQNLIKKDSSVYSQSQSQANKDSQPFVLPKQISSVHAEEEFLLPQDKDSVSQIASQEAIPQEMNGQKDQQKEGSQEYSNEEFEEDQISHGVTEIAGNAKGSSLSGVVDYDIEESQKSQKPQFQYTGAENRQMSDGIEYGVPNIKSDGFSSVNTKLAASKSQKIEDYGAIEEKSFIRPGCGRETSLTNSNVSQERFLNQDRLLTPDVEISDVGFHTQMSDKSGMQNLNEQKENIILSELSLKKKMLE